jgi:cation diffusion facilitator family transporter
VAANKGASDEERGTKRSVLAAFVANFLIAISKFVAGFISGSAAMLAEGAHSVADTVNQVFLLISLPLSKSAPDREHPYGHGKDRFFWSLLVAVGLFVAGAVFSVYEGITKITGESEGGESFLIAYVVLGAAFVFESGALVVSTREFLKSARDENRSFWGHFRTTRNTTMKVPLYEDAAALAGLAIAAAGLLLTQLTGNHLYDGIASIGVGVILGFVAFELGADSRALLLGEAVPPEDEERLREIMTSFEEVTDVLRLLTMHLGPDAVLVNTEIHVIDGLDTDQIEDLLERITQRMREEMPEVAQTFIELHPPGKVG